MGKFGGHYHHVGLHSDGTENKKQETISWSIGSERRQALKLQEAVKCTAYAFSGKFKSCWTGIVTAHFQDGSTFEYAVKGDFESVNWSSGAVSCKPIDIRDVPQRATLGATTPLGKRSVSFRG
jgi:hypothetical protein